jgi:hypothetical protein
MVVIDEERRAAVRRVTGGAAELAPIMLLSHGRSFSLNLGNILPANTRKRFLWSLRISVYIICELLGARDVSTSGFCAPATVASGLLLNSGNELQC